MKNKQLENTKNKQQKNTDTLLKKAGKIVAPLLVAGIMSVTGNADAKKKVETAPVPGPALISGKITECKKMGLIGEGILVAPKNRCEMKVKKDDFVYKIEFVFEEAGYFGLKVLDVDNKGVTFDYGGEIFMAEHYTGKFRINYDGTIMTAAHWKGTWSNLKVEKTSDPKVAKVIWGSESNKTGDVIPKTSRKSDYMPLGNLPFDTAVKQRLDEVRKKYTYLKIEPKVEAGIIKGLYVTNSIFGSGDTKMSGWLDYVSTGVKPK